MEGENERLNGTELRVRLAKFLPTVGFEPEPFAWQANPN